jgi:hypothetical protein
MNKLALIGGCRCTARAAIDVCYYTPNKYIKLFNIQIRPRSSEIKGVLDAV